MIAGRYRFECAGHVRTLCEAWTTEQAYQVETLPALNDREAVSPTASDEVASTAELGTIHCFGVRSAGPERDGSGDDGNG